MRRRPEGPSLRRANGAMSVSLHDSHPVDALPEYARGVADDPGSIERHLAECASCRAELELVRALSEAAPGSLSDVERERVWRGFETRRRAVSGRRRGSPPATGPAGPAWLRVTWRAAAAIALLLGGLGVWQVRSGTDSTDWSPELALEGWEEELAELDVPAGEVRLAFGLRDDPAWQDLTEVNPWDLPAPWEEERP